MSLLDDVSIVVTPNGYKAGELYAVIPVPTEGAEEIDDVSFANDLTNWSKYGVTSATGGIATIGASANSGIYQTILTQGVRYTVTINVVSVNATGTSEVTNGNGTVLYLITETGIQTFTFISAIASGQIIIRGMSNALFSLSNVSVKEYTSADMDVTRATAATRVDENGLVEDVLSNVPRIDYTGGGCPHILAEPMRTNLIPYSEDFTSWVQIQDTTLTANSTTSPSGENDGTKFLSTGTGAKVRENFSAVSGTTYTVSVYCKNIDSTLIKILTYDGVNSLSYDATSEVNTSTWTRISLTFTTANTGSGQIQIARDLPNGESAYFWGAQLEVGSYPTSYIPNFGTALGVTRNQDIFTRDGIGSLINSTEGVLFAEFKRVEGNSTTSAISLNDGTSSNGVSMYFFGVSNFYVDVFSSSGTITLNGGIINTSDYIKVAFKYKNGDSAIWINGIEVTTNSGAISLVGLNQLLFAYINGTSHFYGKVKQLQVYDTALTDDTLALLTS